MIERELESCYLEITAKNGKHFITGSLYRSPNACEVHIISHIVETVSRVRTEFGKKEIMLGMDHNLDLLKSHVHEPTQRFLDTILELDMWPTITRPSRTTQTTVTLCYVFISKSILISHTLCRGPIHPCRGPILPLARTGTLYGGLVLLK